MVLNIQAAPHILPSLSCKLTILLARNSHGVFVQCACDSFLASGQECVTGMHKLKNGMHSEYEIISNRPGPEFPIPAGAWGVRISFDQEPKFQIIGQVLRRPTKTKKESTHM